MATAHAQLGPYKEKLSRQIVRQATAGTGQSTKMGRVSYDGRVTEVELDPAAAIAADATNIRIFTLYNRGQAGAGTVSMATLDTIIAFVDNVPRLMTLSVVAGALEVLQGDRLELVETVGGSGVASGGFDCTVSISRYG